MAKQYEPFLINPPRRLPKMRRSRMRLNPFRRNAPVDDVDSYEQEWNREALRHKVASMAPAGMIISGGKRTKLSKRAQRFSKTLETPAEIKAFKKEWNKIARKKKAVKKVAKAKVAKIKGKKVKHVAKGGSMAKRKVAKKKVTKKRAVKKRVVKRKASGVSKRKRTTKMRKGSKAAKAWGRKMARLRKAATPKRKVSKRRKHSTAKHARSVVKIEKRKVSRKTLRGHKRRHVAVAHYGKAWRTVPGVHKPFRAGVKVNPFKRNPFGSELMVVGANPRRRRRSKKGGSMAKRKRFHSNPMSSIKALAPMIAAGTVGALVTKMAPKTLGMTNVWAGYGVQVAAIVGGGYAADKWLGKQVSDGWIIGGAAVVLSNIISTAIPTVFAGLGLDYAAFPEMGSFPENSGDLGMGMMGNENYQSNDSLI